MKWFKLGIISFIIFSLLLTVFSLFVPSSLRLAKAINIASKGDSIIAFVSDFKNWPQWHPAFFESEPAKWAATDNGWKNETFSISLSEIKDDQVISEIKKSGKKPMYTVWRVIDAPGMDSVAVQWYMDFHLRWYPWEKFSSLFFEKIYGSQMETGLAKMKEILENRSSHK